MCVCVMCAQVWCVCVGGLVCVCACMCVWSMGVAFVWCVSRSCCARIAMFCAVHCAVRGAHVDVLMLAARSLPCT